MTWAWRDSSGSTGSQVVLLLVSFAYQKARGPGAAPPPEPSDAIGGSGGRS